MKKLILGLFAASTLLVSCGSGAEAETEAMDSTAVVAEEVVEEEVDELAFNGVEKGAFMLYGHEDVTADDAVSPEAMFTTFKETGSFNGKVNITVNEVCQKAGCWINFMKDDEPIMVFFRDHFTIPIEESAGKQAVLYGNLEMDTLSVDFQKHLLDDAAEAGEEVTQAEYDAITEEKIDVSFDCLAILLK